MPNPAPLTRRTLIAGAACATALPARAQSGDFQAFLASLRPDARAAGVSDATFSAAVQGLTFDPGPARASGGQSEFSRPFWDYVNNAVAASRVSAGKAAAARAGGTFDWIQSNLGVERGVVAGIWGMESNFGAGMGSSDVLRSTASLAFRQVRGDFYRREFIAALKILEEGHITRERLVGSWAGAMGQPQFLPSSFLKYAVDADGDGRKDIWRSTADALASAANHLRVDGWSTGLPWGFEVSLPQEFDWDYGDRQARHDFGALARIGVRRADGRPMGRGTGGIFLPTGINGPAFVVTDNFEVIRQYNTSDSYALAVGHLGTASSAAGRSARPGRRASASSQTPRLRNSNACCSRAATRSAASTAAWGRGPASWSRSSRSGLGSCQMDTRARRSWRGCAAASPRSRANRRRPPGRSSRSRCRPAGAAGASPHRHCRRSPARQPWSGPWRRLCPSRQ